MRANKAILWTREMDKERATGVIYLDFHNVYNIVPHNIILSK